MLQVAIDKKLLLIFTKKESKLLLKMFLFFIFWYLPTSFLIAQKVNTANTEKKSNSTKEFVISYAISIDGAKKKSMEQTYNGGLKTVFVKNDLLRIRLVSLMRFQSLYFNNKKWVKTNVASLVKESGKSKSILSFDIKQWAQFNKRNDSIRCEIYTDDTVTILNKLCNKAILTFKDSSKLTVYYLPNAKSNIMAAAEPIFSTVPGLVMKYSFQVKNKSITYTAVDFKIAPIANSVFVTPKTGYKKIKYKSSDSLTEITEDADDDIENSGDEDETTPTTVPPTDKK